MISPSHSRMTGDEQIRATRTRRTLDTSRCNLQDSSLDLALDQLFTQEPAVIHCLFGTQRWRHSTGKLVS